MRIPEMSSCPYVTLLKSDAILIWKIYLWLTWRENTVRYCLMLVFLKFSNAHSCCFTLKLFNMSAKEKKMIGSQKCVYLIVIMLFWINGLVVISTRKLAWYVHATLSSANQVNRWAQSLTSCRETLARVTTLLSKQTTNMCRVEMEDRETDGGKKQRGMNQRVKRHQGGGHMQGDTLELCQLQGGKCVCVWDRRTDRGSVLVLPASLLCKLHVTHPASPRGKNTAASSPSSSSSAHSNMKPRPALSVRSQPNLAVSCMKWQ